MAVDDGKIVQAEQAVLGSMLIDAGCVPQLLSEVDERDFSTATYRMIFQAIRALYQEGQPIDAVVVAGRIGAEQYSGLLIELMEVTPTSANCMAYAAIMREQATLARLRGIGAELQTAVSVDEANKLITALTEYGTLGHRVEAWSMAELLQNFMARQTAPPKEYIKYGLPAVDDGTFTERGDVVMIGGAPSDGKTAFALAVAWHMAKDHRVGFFSLETSREKLEDRLVASGFQVSFSAIKQQKLSEQEWQTIADGCADASARDLTVLRSSGMTASDVAAISRARGFEIIFIDYVQLLNPETPRGANRSEQMADVSVRLHRFAQQSRTTVIELAQLSRQERGSKRERDMFDLGESSQFEKDADLILLLYRPLEGTKFNPNDKDSDTLDPQTTRILRVAKNKEGRWGRWVLYFDGDKQSFSTYAPSLGSRFRELHKQIRDAGKNCKDQIQFHEIQSNGSEPL